MAESFPDPFPPKIPPTDGRTKTQGPLILSEDEFVAAEVAATRRAIARGLKDHDGKRVARAEAYARWRYAGYVEGMTRGL